VVSTFPEEGKPAFFKGAVGEYSLATRLTSQPKVKVGEKLSVDLVVSGKGALNTVSLPDICCQPSVSGFFKLDELPPPSTEKDGHTLTWRIDMRPLSASVKQVPSFSFSFFNTEEKKYKTVSSEPIAIEVEPLEELKNKKAAEEKPPVALKTQVEPVEIAMSVPLSPGDVLLNPFLSWWSLLLLPLALALLIYQMRLKDYLDRHQVPKKEQTSIEALKEAMKFSENSSEKTIALKKCLILFLQERGVINPEESLETGGYAEGDSEAVKQAYRLMKELDAVRYSSQPEAGASSQILDKIEALITAFGQPS